MENIQRSVGRPAFEKSEEYRRQVRDTILETAERLFREDGAEAITIRRVVRDSRISTGSLYHHFRDRDAIIDALVERLADEVGEAFDTVTAVLNQDEIDREVPGPEPVPESNPEISRLAESLGRALEAAFARRELMSLVFGERSEPRLRRRIFERFTERTRVYFSRNPGILRQYLSDSSRQESDQNSSHLPVELAVELAAGAWQGSLFAVLDWASGQDSLTQNEIHRVIRMTVLWNISSLRLHS